MEKLTDRQIEWLRCYHMFVWLNGVNVDIQSVSSVVLYFDSYKDAEAIASHWLDWICE